jgi:hypothetical protein
MILNVLVGAMRLSDKVCWKGHGLQGESHVTASTQKHADSFRFHGRVYTVQGNPFIAVSHSATLTAARHFAVTDRLARASAINGQHAGHGGGRSDGLYDSACTYAHTSYVHTFAGWHNVLRKPLG